VAPTPTDPLAAADALLFTGDYDGAEAAYLKLIAAETLGAQVHYVLFLDYEGRFSEAVAQARAAAAIHPDSASLGALTRALDWSADVTGAVDAGSRAVSATSVDPLARAFYSEVAGRFCPLRERARPSCWRRKMRRAVPTRSPRSSANGPTTTEAWATSSRS